MPTHRPPFATLPTRVPRAIALGAGALAAVLAQPVAAGGASPDAGSARLQGDFTMRGTITQADGVPGEHAGQHVTRHWNFNSKCDGGACADVVLHKRRGGKHTDKLVLHRKSPGVYSGKGRFYFPIRCGGMVDNHGGEVRFRVTVHVKGTTTVQGTPFASKLSAKYENPRRINHTQCQGRGLGNDGARYSGSLDSAPGPPKARFRRTDSTSTTLKFEDRSRRGAGGASLSAREWDFGDPVSGPANSSTDARPTHTFTAPGTYTVKLTVTDRNGLTGTVSHKYTVP